MKALRTLLNTLVALSLLVAQAVWAISAEMQDMVFMETSANAMAQRSPGKVIMEHYEIPLELVEKSVALRSNPQFVSSLIVERGGKQFVRWLLNPEDTKWHLEVETFLKENNVSTKKHQYFEGYMTASRSYIAVDPVSGAEFSIKMSTNQTGGHWRDKKQTWDDAKQIRIMTDFVDSQLRKQPKLENIVLLDESIAFGLKNLDQGMVVRSYEGLTKSGKRYVPGFSIMHESYGRNLALLNGSTDPAQFWNDHYNKPLARALAEFMALTGMTYDSPHSQNFLVELDAKSRPTGKIVLRDFGDTYLNKNFFDAINRSDIYTIWEQSNVKKGYFQMNVGILHGNNPPSWMDMNIANQGDFTNASKNSYDHWALTFFQEFDREFKRQTGVQLPGEALVRNGLYILRKYLVEGNAEGSEFLKRTAMGVQRANLNIRSCGMAFAL